MVSRFGNKTCGPLTIRFSQDSVYKNFSDGSTFDRMYRDIARGKTSAAAIPQIRAVKRSDGVYVPHDNSMLLIFQWLAEESYLDNVAVQVVNTPIPCWQYTTQNHGMSIVIRQRSWKNHALA